MESTQNYSQEIKYSLNKEFRLNMLMLIVYLGTVIYGLLGMKFVFVESQQAFLVVVESLVGVAISLLIFLLNKAGRIKMSFSILVFIHLFIVLATLGEICLLYYKLDWWDSMLHLLTGFGIAFSMYCLFDFLTRDSNLKHRFVICLITAIAISLAAELMWEFAEFTLDSLFGSNMQKFMPEIEPFFNGGKTNEFLNGSDEEIANFFRTPKGYRYALQDTMQDLVLNILGTAIFVVTCIPTAKKYKAFYSKGFTKEN